MVVNAARCPCLHHICFEFFPSCLTFVLPLLHTLLAAMSLPVAQAQTHKPSDLGHPVPNLKCHVCKLAELCVVFSLPVSLQMLLVLKQVDACEPAFVSFSITHSEEILANFALEVGGLGMKMELKELQHHKTVLYKESAESVGANEKHQRVIWKYAVSLIGSSSALFDKVRFLEKGRKKF